jgi:hypothetical protein
MGAGQKMNGKRHGRIAGRVLALLAVLVVAFGAAPAFAQEVNEYRQFLGLDSRRLIWFLAQMHLFFGAFVLGVPIRPSWATWRASSRT